MPAMQHALRRNDHLSFRGNLAQTRYGWLRLTPAYSLHLVGDLLDGAAAGPDARVLDPFCGTGTTALACAERGVVCDTTDINPFLLWLTAAKTRPYGEAELADFARAAARVRRAIAGGGDPAAWVPPLHQIEKWWDAPTLRALAAAMAVIAGAEVSPGAADLLRVAFCRTLIERAHVSFGHQSMSFRKRAARPPGPDAGAPIAASWTVAARAIAAAAASPVAATTRALRCDARALTAGLPGAGYTCVVTSPPYPNRMSYVRELRPYMYWLGYLGAARDAGALDWQAIGGTWGAATSNLGRWQPPPDAEVPFAGFAALLARIAEHSPLLSRYVHKYFVDMVEHVASLTGVVAPGGRIHYVVGNSKFYDVLLPVEEIFASLFAAAGLTGVTVRTLRKRTSKKELFEFLVTAQAPPARALPRARSRGGR
jgi:hypothetical protein